MRKHLGLAALALAGALGLGSGPALAVDVTIWCWDTNFNGAAMREAAARYNATHPDVNIIIDDSDTQDNIRAEAADPAARRHHRGPSRHRPDPGRPGPEVPALLPGRLRAAQRLDRYDAVRATTRLRPRRSTASPTRCPSTPASPASSIAPTTSRKPASRTRTCRTSPGTS